MSQVIADVLRPALSHRPAAPAVVARSGTLTYADLDRAAAAAAGAMWELGVRPGDRVAACLPNDLDIVVAFHGTMRIGAIWVGINEAYARDEQQALADLAAPALVVAGPRWKADGTAALSTQEWARVTAAAPQAPTVEIDPDAPAGIAFTSGTTGVPKGIVHSQRNMLLPGAALVRTRGWGPGLRKGDCLPLTLLNMQILTTLLTAQAEGCCVLMDRRDVTGVAEWIVRERVTVWNGVPAQLYDLARRPGLDLSGLEEVWCGGAACPDELRQAFHDVHGVPVRATYGLTEAPTVVAIDPVAGAARAGAAGQVLPQLDVAAYDEARPAAAGRVYGRAAHRPGGRRRVGRGLDARARRVGCSPPGGRPPGIPPRMGGLPVPPFPPGPPGPPDPGDRGHRRRRRRRLAERGRAQEAGHRARRRQRLPG